MNSVISDVIVYNQNATIIRKVSINLSAGESRVEVSRLPIGIDPQSICVNSEMTHIIAVEAVKSYVMDMPNKENINKLNIKRDKLINDSNILNSDILALEMQIDAMKSIFGGAKNIAADINILGEVIDYAGTKTAEVHRTLFDKKLDKADLQGRIDKVDKEISQYDNNARECYVVYCDTDNSIEAEVEFEISYISYNCGWNIQYKLGAKNAVEVDYEMTAYVSQFTGEDWNDVKLTVSNGSPGMGKMLPEFRPEYLQTESPIVARTMSRRTNVNLMCAMDESADGTAAYSKAADNGAMVMEYELSAKQTVISGGNSKAITVSSEVLPCEYIYYAMPKRDKHCYRVARVNSLIGRQLMPGEVVVKSNGRITDKSYFNGGELDKCEFALGVDNSILCKYDKAEDYVGKTLIGGNERTTCSYEITIQNNKATTVTVDLIDQIPVSCAKIYSVDVIETNGALIDNELGKLTWRICLKGGENRKIKVKYNIIKLIK